MIGFLFLTVVLPLALLAAVYAVQWHVQRDRHYKYYDATVLVGVFVVVSVFIGLLVASIASYDRGVQQKRCDVLAEQNPSANPTWNDYGFFSYECRYTERQTDTPNWVVLD